jgi:hypothetical protein
MAGSTPAFYLVGHATIISCLETSSSQRNTDISVVDLDKIEKRFI